MKRWLTRILVCLAMGVVTTVGVAWGFAAWSAPANVETPEFTSRKIAEDEIQTVTSLRAFGQTRVNHGWISRLIVDGTAKHVTATEWIVPGDNYSEVRAGWPLRTLRCRNLAEIDMGRMMSTTMVAHTVNPIEGGIVLSPFSTGSPAQSWRALPYQPIWTGVIVNTLFYAVIWFGLFFGPGTARRAIRRKRGRCVKCAYDLRGSPDAGCSECGWGRK